MVCVEGEYTCVSCAQPDLIIGRSGRSISRDVRISWSFGRPSRLMNPCLPISPNPPSRHTLVVSVSGEEERGDPYHALGVRQDLDPTQ